MSSQSVGCIKYMNDMVAIAKLPPEEWSAKFATARQQFGELPMIAATLAPATDKIAQAVQRSHGQQRCAIVALACERFRKKNDRWPNSLDELKAAGMLAAIPTDPYVGGPLKLNRTSDGLLIYVVGQDLKDDGGICDRANPMKTGHRPGLRSSGTWPSEGSLPRRPSPPRTIRAIRRPRNPPLHRVQMTGIRIASNEPRNTYQETTLVAVGPRADLVYGRWNRGLCCVRQKQPE